MQGLGREGEGGSGSPLPSPIKKKMYTMEEGYSSGKEARNKCMSDCPDLHGVRWLGLQRKMMELLLWEDMKN